MTDPVAELQARVDALEHKGSTEVKNVVSTASAFVKKNWAHFVTWALVSGGPAILAKLVHL